ncbi:MAG: septum formation initiator family protein [Ruminococcus sp.]|nr:septum formation initiator family protein [Ruminococcus sp.]
MDYYYRSSLAYDLTLFEETGSEKASEQSGSTADKPESRDGSTRNDHSSRRGRNAKTKKGSKKDRRRTKLGRIIFGVIAGLLMAFVVVSIIHGQVQLTELNQEIADAKARLAEQQSIYTQLEMKVDSSISTTVVEDYAKNSLHMSKASNSQKEFVNLSDGDKAEVTLSEDKNIFESIAEAISSLWS